MSEFRSWLHPEDQAGARHSLSPVEAEKRTMMTQLDAVNVSESTDESWHTDIV